MAKNKINIVNSKKIKNSSKKIEYYYPEGYNKNNISINPYAPKKLTPEQMGQAQFDEVRGCSCQYSMFWTNYYCYGSTCQNGGAQCWNNSAACSERPPDPKNKMFSQSHRGAGNSSSDKSIRQSISIEDQKDINTTKMLLNETQLPLKHHSEVIDLMNWYKSGGTSYRWEPPKSCSGCGGGVGRHGCAGICVNGTAKKDKWKFTISWSF